MQIVFTLVYLCLRPIHSLMRQTTYGSAQYGTPLLPHWLFVSGTKTRGRIYTAKLLLAQNRGDKIVLCQMNIMNMSLLGTTVIGNTNAFWLKYRVRYCPEVRYKYLMHIWQKKSDYRTLSKDAAQIKPEFATSSEDTLICSGWHEESEWRAG